MYAEATPEPRPLPIRRSEIRPISAVGALAIFASLLATLFGFLNQAKQHPDVKLAGSMILTVAGMGVVLLLRPLMRRQDQGQPIDHNRPTLRSIETLWLAMLSMATR